MDVVRVENNTLLRLRVGITAIQPDNFD